MSACGRNSIVLAVFSVVLAISAAAIPNFGNNAINLTPIPGVAGVYTVADNSATVTKTQLPNGFMVNYAYTITSADGQTMVDTTWTATRQFCLGVPAENLAVTISGSTTVSSNNAPTLRTADFVVNGTILGQNPDVDFFQNRPLANNMAINWNRTSNAANVPGNNACYTLQMFSGPVWTPSAVGDTISFQSQYVVQVISAQGAPMPSPTPVPSPTPMPSPSPMPSPTPMPSPSPSPATLVPDQPNAPRSLTFIACLLPSRDGERQPAGEGRYVSPAEEASMESIMGRPGDQSRAENRRRSFAGG